MGYNIDIYLARTSFVNGIVGCGLGQIIDDILRSQAEFFTQWDDELGDHADDEDPPLRHADALRELVAGRFTRDHGDQYALAYMAACSHDGSYLSNRGLSAMPSPSKFLKQLDETMLKQQVPLLFSDLVFNQPVKFPTDNITVGHWTHRLLCDAAPALERCVDEINDHDVKAAVANALDIAREVMDYPYMTVVGFLM